MVTAAYLLAFRAVVVYFVILIVTRILGKRELGQVSPFDFVVAIMLGELAVLSIDDSRMPILLGLVPITIITVLHVAIAYVSMKSSFARVVLSGRPTVMIENGRIIEKNLAALHFNVNDLLGSLREKGVFDLNDVEFAIMENTGKLSVLLRSQKRPLTPDDIDVPTVYEGMTKPLIIDGQVQENYLREANLSQQWLEERLRKIGVGCQDVLLASLDTRGQLYVSRRDQPHGPSTHEPPS